MDIQYIKLIWESQCRCVPSNWADRVGNSASYLCLEMGDSMGSETKWREMVPLALGSRTSSHPPLVRLRRCFWCHADSGDRVARGNRRNRRNRHHLPLIGVPGGRQFLELQPADEAPRMSRDPASQTLAVDLSALVCNIGEHFIQFNVVGVGADTADKTDENAHHRRSVADHLVQDGQQTAMRFTVGVSRHRGKDR